MSNEPGMEVKYRKATLASVFSEGDFYCGVFSGLLLSHESALRPDGSDIQKGRAVINLVFPVSGYPPKDMWSGVKIALDQLFLNSDFQQAIQCDRAEYYNPSSVVSERDGVWNAFMMVDYIGWPLPKTG